MEVTIEHIGSAQFEIRAGKHVILSDQPQGNGGFDEGMTPPELLLASLGSCAAYYAAEYLKRQKLASEGTRVSISAEKKKNPARLDDFRIIVDSPVELTEEHRRGIDGAIHRCLIHETMQHPPNIEIRIGAPVPAAA